MKQPMFVSKQSLVTILFKFVIAPIFFMLIIYFIFSSLSTSVLVIVLAFVITIVITLIAIGFNVSKVVIDETSIKSISVFREVSTEINEIISMAVVNSTFNTGLNYQIKTKDRTITFDIPSNWKEFEEYIINKAELELENTAAVIVLGDYPKVRRWKKRGMEYISTGIKDSFMGFSYLGGRVSKSKFVFALTIFLIVLVIFIFTFLRQKGLI